MKNKSKISLLSILVVFVFTLSGCFINDTEWPGFSVSYDSSEITEPGPVENPDDQPPEGDDPNEHDHIYGDWQYDGTYHWKECTICGDIIDKAEHTLGYTDNDDDETHAIHCEICEYTSSANHDLSYVSDDDTYHHEECSECDYKTEKEEHNYEIVVGSYTASGHTVKCSDCEHEMTENHEYTSVVTTDPTCTDGGYTTYTCECGYSYTSDHKDALGHDWGEWTDNGSDETHTRTCSRCNGTDTEEHEYEVTNITEIDIPTATALYEYTCTVCGHVKEVTEAYTFDFATDSWEIINEVSTLGYASTYYKVGDTKPIIVGEEEHNVRIIDFDHDKLSPDDGDDDDDDDEERKTAGMTIEMVDCLETEYQLNSTDSYTSWENCSLKTALDGEIFDSLPEDLQEVIKGVQKKTNNGSGNATVSDSENNKLFLPAIAELYSEDGITNTTDQTSDLYLHQSIYLQEGKQYAYYATLIGDQDPKANCVFLEKVVPGKDDGDVQNGYWVRSPNSNSANYVWRFGYRADEGHDYCMYNDDHPTVERGVSFMFCV